MQWFLIFGIILLPVKLSIVSSFLFHNTLRLLKMSIKYNEFAVLTAYIGLLRLL